MKLKEIFEKVQNFLFPVAVLFATVVLANYLLIPRVNDIFTMRQTIKNQETEENDLSTYLQYLQKLAVSPLEVEQEIVNYALPKDKDVATLIITYEGLSKLADVVVSPLTIEPGVIYKKEKEGELKNPPSEEDKLKGEPREVEFKMTAEGKNMEAVKKLINSILETRRILELTSINLKYQEDKKIGFDASLLAYYYPDPNPKSNLQRLNEISYDEVIAQISQAIVYENAILRPVELGKNNLFASEEEKTTTSGATILSPL